MIICYDTDDDTIIIETFNKQQQAAAQSMHEKIERY
jgi:hypothetical protein